jgi:L-alanine-DL-glutamate epimerase-like enolase superfamily enzyme
LRIIEPDSCNKFPANSRHTPKRQQTIERKRFPFDKINFASHESPTTNIQSNEERPLKTDIRTKSAELFLIPVTTRVPIKFGPEVLTEVTCARVRICVEDRAGKSAEGWGETPLNVQWTWPSHLSYADRHEVHVNFCRQLTIEYPKFAAVGHPIEIGYDFISQVLPGLIDTVNENRDSGEEFPYLAALVCASAFDLAIHDAFGNLHERDIYSTYNSQFLSRDLASFLETEEPNVSFGGLFPDTFLSKNVPSKLAAWHLIGGLDPLDADELTGDEPDDGYPVLLEDWIERDGLFCLKIKLRGNDSDWDYQRLVRVGKLALKHDVTWLTADFNCTVHEASYVTELLDRLLVEHPLLYRMLLYIEQPFPYDLEKHAIDARSIAARKPVFLDESAHDWQHIRLGRELGWSGVALKTCKTQTGAILSLCWARAHGMPLMVQDLANPMLAQVSHLRLAAHAETIMGVETNSMQFYPAVSAPEAKVHPGMFTRRSGQVDLSTLGGHGLMYRVNEIRRDLP